MLVVLTANHRNAPFATLEKLAAASSGTAVAIMEHSDAIAGVVILATCNRFEAYLDVADGATAGLASETALAAVSQSTGVPAAELAAATSVLSGDDVVPHLFGVSAGLKSVIVGEDEIAGQVRRSLEQARATGTVTTKLERLFQTASRTSRGVKTRTALGHASRSMVRLALELASSRIADWAETRVLLIGTGQYAGTTVAALRDRGALDIAVFSPSGRAAPFALRHGLTAAESLASAIAEADIVVTCTSNEHPVVTPAVVSSGKRRLIIDLGLPRNVDAPVGTLHGIELLDLETIRLHAPLEELTATSDAHHLVDNAVAQFAQQAAERSTASAIVALRKHVFSVLEAELDRSRRRGTLSDASEADMRHLVGVLLHTPSVRARELARDGDGQAFVDGLTAVFGLQGEAPATGAAAEDTSA